MVRALLFALLILTPGWATAKLVPQATRADLIRQALDGFWGRARTPDGKVIQPKSELERRRLPVTEQVAHFAFNVGELSGLAEWCHLDWKPTFTALTRSARKNGQSEKQVAFISVVHGVAQAAVATSLEKTGQCSPQNREKVRSQMASFLTKQPR